MNELWYLQILCMVSGSAAIALLAIDLWLIQKQRVKKKRKKGLETKDFRTEETQVIVNRWEDILWIATGKNKG